ncbi:hypothetical protein GUJ93_ZPchr0012g19731 [Zizania palustris]|uniref:Uncharacterized protein n=1 Tax=Zizania palustris TaxID=103762 RepID=A0A8J6BWW4_ZIZPA|nr:hypothetical protein GUJ93_ZPchr0012g19731 [Zizania palustris]
MPEVPNADQIELFMAGLSLTLLANVQHDQPRDLADAISQLKRQNNGKICGLQKWSKYHDRVLVLAIAHLHPQW